MTDKPQTSDAQSDRKPGWADLFRDGHGLYTVLLNLGIGLHALDIFIINTVMPSVVEDIGGHAYYTWPTMIYMVGSIMGAACGFHMRTSLGQRRGYMWGGIVMLVGTIGCALPPDMASLLVARFVKGLGGGFIMSQTMMLIRGLYSPRIRTRMLGTITTTWSIAAIIGPAIGGIFAELEWWRGAFWTTVPFGVLFIWMVWRHVPLGEATEPHRRLPWRRLLLLGAGVTAVGLTGNFENVWIGGGLVALAIAMVWGTFKLDANADEGLFPKRPLSLRTPVGLAYWSFFLLSATHSALLIFAPLFLIVLHDVTPLYVGYLSLVFSIAWTVGALTVAGFSETYERIAAVGGFTLAAFATAGFTVAVLSGTQFVISAMVSLIGVGIGASNVLITSYGMSIPRQGEEGVTISSMPTIRSIGVAFGAATAGLIANSAGLDQNMSRETVANVALWVLGATAVIPALAALCTFRAVTWGWSYRTDQ
ncbi:MAG: MFS transporter [Rhodospirillaceae bacterium]|jgi:MFS family permease|nr:MFS transporter [Rhodospirillaceae bacterium]MBT5048633.1 MFS transporter [Rhodospirillaceae bacterium]MBT5459683.1 MFS transporter [Rhodospirillaceae bacterium]